MNKKKIFTLSFVIITTLFFSCKEQEKPKTAIIETPKNKKLTFDNFLFFKKNATSNDILSLLDQKKILHGPILKSEYSEQTGITTLKIKSLKIIDQIFPIVEIKFVNDIIAELIFSTDRHVYEDYLFFYAGDNSKNQINSLNNLIKEDNLIYGELFDALKEKYGIPPNAKYFDITNSGVEIYEFEMGSFDTYKQIDFNHQLIWKSNKDVQIIIDRYYNCDGGFDGEKQTKVILDYTSFFKVQFEKKLIDNATEKYNIAEQINQQKKENEVKLQRKRILDGI
jgi:hypothetical protein